MEAVKNWTNDRPIACPWRSFYDPFVKDVLFLYPFYMSGQLSLVVGQDPPLFLMEGLAHYHRTVESIRNKQMEAEIKKRKRDAK